MEKDKRFEDQIPAHAIIRNFQNTSFVYDLEGNILGGYIDKEYDSRGWYRYGKGYIHT